MKSTHNSTSLIVMYFPKYAGGKFILNCLALSKYTVPQNIKIAEYLIQNPADYEYRFDEINKTLPKTRKEMLQWSNYEFSHDMFFGPSEIPKSWYLDGISKEYLFNDLTNTLIERNFKFFMTIHGGNVNWVKNIVKVWPKSTVINLINYNKFWNIAHSLKNPNANSSSLGEFAGNDYKDKYELIAGPSWPTWEFFESVNYNVNLCDLPLDIATEMKQFYRWYEIDNPIFAFDIDNSIFDRELFLIKMKELYDFLNFDDFNSELVQKFWYRYMCLHVDNLAPIS